MAYSAYDLGEDERALKSLLGALKKCLIAARTRAEEIADLDLWNYRHSFETTHDPDEAADLARFAFDGDVDQAEAALQWRGVVVADLVGEAMARYARARSPLDDPWMAWRYDPPEDPCHFFVRGLSEEEFFCARLAHHTHSSVNLRRPRRIPSDGDLKDIPGYLETEYGSSWVEWLEVLGRPPGGVDLGPAIAAAKRDLTAREGNAAEEALLINIKELTDIVSAFQMPVIEQLESIGAKVDALGAGDRFRAEASLKEALGDRVYLSLKYDARTAALEAERRFRDQGTVDWNSVVHGYAKAFEIQLKQVLLPELAKYFEERDFPDHEPMPCKDGQVRKEKKPIIKGGKPVTNSTLREFGLALASESPKLSRFGQDRGFDLPRLRKCIDGLTNDRNAGAHATGMTFATVQRLRDEWLGVGTGDGGIFGSVLPKGLI